MSNKFKFIQTLLDNEKFDPNQKEKFFKLVSKELEKSGDINIEGLEKDIQLIKEKLGIKESKQVGDNKTNKITGVGSFDSNKSLKKGSVLAQLRDFSQETNKLKSKYDWIPNYINPEGIYKYLFDYNNNLILKSTCHKIDSNELKTINEICETDTYDFDKHLKKIIEAFEAHNKNYAPAFIKSFMRLYLTGKDYNGNSIGSYVKGKLLGWTEDKITFSWSDSTLLKWSEKNQGIPPCPSTGIAKINKNLGFEFESPIENSFETSITTFSKLILHFKKMFHIKSDNSLKQLISQQNKIKAWNDKIDFVEGEFPIKIELFTYVERVLQLYNKLIELTLEKANEKPKVKLILKENKEAVYFTIHHLNTEYKKSTLGIEERLHGQTYKNLIKNQINGLCDFFVEADLGEGKYLRFNIWDNNYANKSKNPLQITRLENPVEGVAHIMQFKKK